MPGQLGNVKNTIQNLVANSSEDNIMLVRGSVPGFNGANLIIKPTRKKYTPKILLTEEVANGKYSSDENNPNPESGKRR